MPSESEFTSLVRLLDDESETVREAVSKQLLDYEDHLPDYVSQLDPLPSAAHFALMNRLLREAKCETLSDHWDDVLTENDPSQRLELALGLLSDYLEGRRLRSGRLTQELDDLASELRKEGGKAKGPMSLAQGLFESGRLVGNRSNYYAPENSNLLTILSSGKGNPISLACVFILVGQRMGYDIQGCNYPGHFLALIPRSADPVLIDCFNRGQIVSIEDLIRSGVDPGMDLKVTLETGASTEIILLRVLRNLERAFQEQDNECERLVIEFLIERMLVSGAV